MQNNEDETAFPVAIGQTAADMKGLSMRDWFAGMAMNGLLSSEFADRSEADLAEMAYRQANEMMEARKTLG
jgi:hypothetical protein